jgi:hypothetical protein
MTYHDFILDAALSLALAGGVCIGAALTLAWLTPGWWRR